MADVTELKQPRVTWVREIPKGSPLLQTLRLPEKELEAVRLWGSTFFAFQRPWVFDPARFALCCKGRQIGISHATAGSIILWSAFCRESTAIVSKDNESAIETLTKVKEHARMLRALGSEMARTVRSSDTEIVFATGGRVQAFPHTGARSFTGNVVLEELAYNRDAVSVWDASAPVATTGKHRMRVISTPEGVGNVFHQRYVEASSPGSKWKFYEIPMSAAVADGYPVDMDACWVLAQNDPRLFEQMYNCSFLDAVLQYVPSELINAARIQTVLHRDGPGLYYAGLDIARNKDLTVLAIGRAYQGQLYPVHIEEMKRTDEDAMQAMVAWAFKTYRLRRLCVDETGMGTFPADRMKKLHGDIDVPYRRNKVAPINFSSKQKKDAVMTGLYSAIAEGVLRLPDGDAQLPSFTRQNLDDKGKPDGLEIAVNLPGTAELLRKEIASIQRVVTQSQNIVYEMPRTRDGHGDHAMAVALMAHAVDEVHPAVAALLARRRLTG